MGASKLSALLTTGLMATCVLNACYQAKSPAQVAQDTTAAQSAAAEKTEKALEKASDKVNDAQQVVHDEQTAAAHTRAVETEKVLVAQAEGRHKIDLAKCEALAGESQKSCREQADAAFNVAEDQAKQVKTDSDPKP